MLVDLDVIGWSPLRRMDHLDRVIPDILIEDLVQEVALQGIGQRLYPIPPQPRVAKDLPHAAAGIASVLSDQRCGQRRCYTLSSQVGQNWVNLVGRKISALRSPVALSSRVGQLGT